MGAPGPASGDTSAIRNTGVIPKTQPGFTTLYLMFVTDSDYFPRLSFSRGVLSGRQLSCKTSTSKPLQENHGTDRITAGGTQGAQVLFYGEYDETPLVQSRNLTVTGSKAVKNSKSVSYKYWKCYSPSYKGKR